MSNLADMSVGLLRPHEWRREDAEQMHLRRCRVAVGSPTPGQPSSPAERGGSATREVLDLLFPAHALRGYDTENWMLSITGS